MNFDRVMPLENESIWVIYNLFCKQIIDISKLNLAFETLAFVALRYISSFGMIFMIVLINGRAHSIPWSKSSWQVFFYNLGKRKKKVAGRQVGWIGRMSQNMNHPKNLDKQKQ